jgi:hypothetical protein
MFDPMDEVRYRYRLAMTPFPPFGWGFTVGGLVRYSLYGVNGFVLGVVVTVGYHPTGSSDLREANPLPGGTTPKHQTPQRS